MMLRLAILALLRVNPTSSSRQSLFQEDTTQPNGIPIYNSSQFPPIIPLLGLPSSQKPGATHFGHLVMRFMTFSQSRYQKFFEGLTATFIGDGFLKVAAADPENVTLYEGERGSPRNVGMKLSAVHPVVRTNPVTGWKSIFALGTFPKYINELTMSESTDLLKKFIRCHL